MLRCRVSGAFLQLHGLLRTVRGSVHLPTREVLPGFSFPATTISFPSAISMMRQSVLCNEDCTRMHPANDKRLIEGPDGPTGYHIKYGHLPFIVNHRQIGGKISSCAGSCDLIRLYHRVESGGVLPDCPAHIIRRVPDSVNTEVPLSISRIFACSTSPYSTAIAAIWLARTSAAFV